MIRITFSFSGISRLTTFGNFFNNRRTKIRAAILVQHRHRPFTSHRFRRFFNLTRHQNGQLLGRRIFPNFRHPFHMLGVTININASSRRFRLQIIRRFVRVTNRVGIQVSQHLLFQLQVAARSVHRIPTLFTVGGMEGVVTNNTFAGTGGYTVWDREYILFGIITCAVTRDKGEQRIETQGHYQVTLTLVRPAGGTGGSTINITIDLFATDTRNPRHAWYA